MPDKKEFEQAMAAWLGDHASESKRDELSDTLDSIYGAGPVPSRVSKAQDLVRWGISEIKAVSIYYDVMRDSPIGPIFVGVDAQGVVAIKIDSSEKDFVSELEQKFKTVVTRAPEKLADVIDQLREYFEGRRSSFSIDLNLNQLTQFQQKVLLATLDVPHGQSTTYGEIARRLGKVRLARAVGQALARNPIPIVIPCHRVLSADGSLHGYSGGKGLETKGHLLRLEGASQGL